MGIVSLYERPDTRIVDANLADGYRLTAGQGDDLLIVKDGHKAGMSAQRALECGVLQLPLLL
jgi:hypothetical protein